jgi:DNA-directed RNA polymerase specialized sigma24 family protein
MQAGELPGPASSAGCSRGDGRLSLVNRPPAQCNREQMDDDELIASLAGGDDAALRELFFRHAPWLAARLRASLPAADVEDVLQETFLAVWRGARRYQPQGSAPGWLWGIGRRQAALWLRRRGQPPLLLSEVAADEQRAGDPAEAAQWRADLGSPSTRSGRPAARNARCGG